MGIPEKRRLEIKKQLKQDESVSVSKLAEKFDVSEITIRRDLNKLEGEGFLHKVHGGAMSRGLSPESYPVYIEDIEKNIKQKEKIVKHASSYIEDGQAVIIESGTTCQELTYHLKEKKNLRIFTASIPIAYELWKLALNRNDMEVNICGGLVELKSNTLIGGQATDFFKNIYADIAFIGAVAVSMDKGVISTNSQLDADVTRSIAENSKKKILVVDSSKFKKSAHISALPLNIFSVVVTDRGIDKDSETALKKFKINYKLV
ncbi:DeoR/GlpR family DNA-binding transcription regulator [Actinomycetota bacterium]